MLPRACLATLLAKAPRKGNPGNLHLGPVQKAVSENCPRIAGKWAESL